MDGIFVPAEKGIRIVLIGPPSAGTEPPMWFLAGA
jgi:hypothetical protein